MIFDDETMRKMLGNYMLTEEARRALFSQIHKIESGLVCVYDDATGTLCTV